MLISFVWLYMFKCDVYAQILDKTQKYFWVFYLFLKVILYFRAFSFCSKCIFVFFFKNWFKGCFVKSSRLRASRKKVRKGNKFFDSLYRNFCDYLATISRPKASREMQFGQNWIFPNSDRSYCGCIATVSRFTASRESFCALEVSLVITSWLRRYCLTHEKHVFSVLYSKYDSFSNT